MHGRTGNLSLADDISKFVPEFPLQGHHVTVRQLLNHTSGIVDYHYLGDPIEATSREPKALDEVMALYADKKWVHEPGTKWDWSISGFQLLVTILKRVTGQNLRRVRPPEYLQPCRSQVHSLWRRFHAGPGIISAYPLARRRPRPCSRGWHGLQHRPAVLQHGRRSLPNLARRPGQETPPFRDVRNDGDRRRRGRTDERARSGNALWIGAHAESRRRPPQHRPARSLLGFSGRMYEFPADRLTIVVLTNTEGQNAYAISRALARAILGLRDLPQALHLSRAFACRQTRFRW